MIKRDEKSAAHAFLEEKKSALEDLLWSAGVMDQQPDRFDREVSAFLSHLVDDFSFSVSSPDIESLTRDSGTIGHLNRLVADSYGVTSARVWTAGSSVAVLAVLGVLTRKVAPDRTVIVCDPYAHKSAYGALVISGMSAAFLPTALHRRFAIPEPAKPADVCALLEKHGDAVAAVFVTSPTYEGFDADLEAIAAACRERGALLIVDSAWGSQYGLFPRFPASAARHADIVIISPHKAGLTPLPNRSRAVSFRRARSAV